MTELNENNFMEYVSGELPVLVDFWAPWCGPCRSQTPILEQFAAEHGDKIKVYKVNVDECEGLAMRYKIMSIPTLILFKNGAAVNKAVGLQSLKGLSELTGIN